MSRSSTPNTQIWDPVSPRSSSRRHSSFLSSDYSSLPSSRVSRDTQRTQLWNPLSEQQESSPRRSASLSHMTSTESFSLAPEKAEKWEVSNRWSFIPPRPTSPASPTTSQSADGPPDLPPRAGTPNFSRPFYPRAELHPQVLPETEEERNPDESRAVADSQRSSYSSSSGRDRYSAKELYSNPSSGDSGSRAATISSSNSTKPLLPETEQRWIPPPPPPPKSPLRALAAAENQKQSEQPKEAVGPARVPEDEREKSYWTSRGAALPGTVSRPYEKPASEEGSGFEQQPSGEKKWTSSTYDTSSLTDKQIAKMKKKGINPSLYCEMKAAQGGKGKFGLSPLVGNVFLG